MLAPWVDSVKLTTKGRYAVTAMLDLALHESTGPVSLSAISERQELSVAYLEQLFAKLRKKGLVVSARGPGGGYTLGAEKSAISIARILGAVDETVDARSCSGMTNCHEGNECLTHHLWDDLTDQIRVFLSGISLADMVERQEVKSVHARQSGNGHQDGDLRLLNL